MAENRQVLMARQPIFDSQLRVVAYELLYRTDDEPEIAHILNGHQATSDVLVNAYTSIIEQREYRRLPVFVNLPREMFETDALPTMSKHHLVIEVLENITPDQTLIDAVRHYKASGYRIALDDFVDDPKYDPLLALADIVKIDIRIQSMAEVRKTIARLQRFQLTLLAEKIETYEELRECISLGFTLFQGYFLRRPELVEGRRLDSHQMVLLQLLAELNHAEPHTDTLVELIEQDPTLTYRLLRIVNSAALSHGNRISSVREALVLLGLDELRKWVSLLALSGQQRKPPELTREILLASRMCELVVQHQQLSISPESAFLSGVLKRLDALLDIDRTQMLSQINIADNIRAALAGGDSELARILRLVYDYCDGRWARLPADEQSLYQRSYLESLAWVNDAMTMLEA